MNGVLTSVVAIFGTLAGSALTYLFGLLNARRTERAARDERLRQERINAYTAFVGAMTELRQVVTERWFLRQRGESELARAAYTEADRRGAAADHCRFRVRMLTDDAELLRLADAAFEPIDALRQAADLTALQSHEAASQAVLSEFIRAAGQLLR